MIRWDGVLPGALREGGEPHVARIVRHRHQPAYLDPVAGIRVYLELGNRRIFACALDWPGWARSGRDQAGALKALHDYAPRYAAVAGMAGLAFPLPAADDYEVVEHATGTATTDYGALDTPARADEGPHDDTTYQQAATMTQAAWDYLDAAVATTGPVLRAGPRGGGRDRNSLHWHVLETEILHARMLGGRHRPPAAGDTAAIAAARGYVMTAIGAGSLSEPAETAPSRRPVLFVARRTAWHSLDHAWELQDRSPSPEQDDPPGAAA